MAHAGLLALDAGTTSAKALLIDVDSGTVVGRSSVPVALGTPQAGYVEQDPRDLAGAVFAAGAQVVAHHPDVELVGIGVSNQRESVVAWDARSGEPLGPLLSWQDARTAAWVAALPEEIAPLVRDRSGLTLDPMYSAPKMRWLIDHAQGSADRVRLGTVDSWLVHCLTGEWAIEAGNASRTLLLNVSTGDWDAELLEAFTIPRAMLPDVRPSDAGFGETKGVPGLPDGVPVIAVMADSHAALYAHATRGAGIAKATYGTGTSVMVPVSRAGVRIPGIDTTLAWWALTPTYALEGNILSTGQAIDWAASMMGSDISRPGGAVLAELAAGVPDSGGVTLVPAFTGLGAPYWDRQAVAVLSGMTLSTSRAHIARATIESVAHQVTDLLDAMQASVEIAGLQVDGGASSIDLLVGVQADLLDRPVSRAREPALSALGVAHLAARRRGQPLPPIEVDDPANPRMGSDNRTRARTEWQRAVRRSRSVEQSTQPRENP